MTPGRVDLFSAKGPLVDSFNLIDAIVVLLHCDKMRHVTTGNKFFPENSWYEQVPKTLFHSIYSKDTFLVCTIGHVPHYFAIDILVVVLYFKAG